MKSTKIIPKWFSILGYFVALFLLLTWSVNRSLVLVLPIWITIFILVILGREDSERNAGQIEAAGIVYVEEKAWAMPISAETSRRAVTSDASRDTAREPITACTPSVNLRCVVNLVAITHIIC
ncbi:MAG: hypothetical protein R2845_00700 [Thermomicrobiales bacterium]